MRWSAVASNLPANPAHALAYQLKQTLNLAATPHISFAPRVGGSSTESPTAVLRFLSESDFLVATRETNVKVLGAMSRTTQIWDTNSPMISNATGAPVLEFGTTQVCQSPSDEPNRQRYVLISGGTEYEVLYGCSLVDSPVFVCLPAFTCLIFLGAL
eukprot:SAG31_NODE_2234_length_6128_cov_44.016752_2_plen_157_part_00